MIKTRWYTQAQIKAYHAKLRANRAAYDRTGDHKAYDAQKRLIVAEWLAQKAAAKVPLA